MSKLVILFAFLVAAAACARTPSAAPTGAAPAANPPVSSVSQPAASTTSGRVGGVVEGVDNGTVQLLGGERFSLSPDARLIRSVPVDPTTVQAGEFVAVTARRTARFRPRW